MENLHLHSHSWLSLCSTRERLSHATPTDKICYYWSSTCLLAYYQSGLNIFTLTQAYQSVPIQCD